MQPRLTIQASAAESRTIARSVERLIVPELCIRVDQIAVVESRLSPKGPRYATRFDIRLGQPEV
jgi:2'-5' RNA ligase